MTKTARRTPIAILASGRGSNFEALMTALDQGRFAAEVKALICDKPGAPVLEKARARGIPAILLHQPGPAQPLGERKLHWRDALLRVLEPLDVRFLVLAGYMRILHDDVIEAYRDPRGYARIVNIHPSLLPAFPGLHSYEQAFRHGCKVTGATVHFVEPEMDSGPICAQEAFAIDGCRDADEVERLGLALEHRLYPETLRWILEEKFDLQCRDTNRRRLCCVRPN